MNLLESDVKISLFRDRQKDLVQFFLMESDIHGLMAALRQSLMAAHMKETYDNRKHLLRYIK